MLPAPLWKLEALARLIASVVISVLFLGACASSIMQVLLHPGSRSLLHLLGLSGAFLLLLASLLVLQRRWDLDRLPKTVAWLMGCLYAGLALLWLTVYFLPQSPGFALPTAARVLIAVISFQGAALVFVHGFLRQHAVGWREAFGLNLQPFKAVAIGLLVGSVCVPLMGALQILIVAALRSAGVPAPEQEAVQILRESTGWTTRAVIGVMAVLVAPIAEEVLFRGILYPALRQFGSRQLALWLTAFLFSVIHGNLSALLPLALISVVLTVTYERTQNLTASIVAHTVFNAANFIMLFNTVGRPFPIPK